MKTRIEIPVAEVKAIPLSELARLAGSKRKVAQLAGLQNLGSINPESVLIGGVLYCPSKSTADWQGVWDELVEKGNISTDKWTPISICTSAGGSAGGEL